MKQIKIRNRRGKGWRTLRWVGIISFIISFGLVMLVSGNPVTPERMSGEGQFCEVTADWMSEAFAVETWDDEDMYDFHLIRSGDKFMIISSWLDDEEFREYIDSLYDEDGNYIPVEREFTGGSGIIEDDLKELALEELSWDMDMFLTEADYDTYFYPYYLDTTNMGDFDTVMWLLVVSVIILLAGVAGSAVSALKHRRKIAALKNKIFYERMVDCWSRSDGKMDTGKRPMVVLSDYLIVPEYSELVLPVERIAWCYSMPQGRKDVLYGMGFDGRVIRLCTAGRRSGMSADDYMQQISTAAPWCRVGYTEENRKDFGGMKRKQTLEQIAAEKNKYLSQIPL